MKQWGGDEQLLVVWWSPLSPRSIQGIPETLVQFADPERGKDTVREEDQARQDRCGGDGGDTGQCIRL
jgi:hypothetical protein